MKKTDDSRNYFISIADYVRKKRLSPLLLSSSEGQILLDWEKMGVPLDIVIHSIDMAYDKAMETKGKRKKSFNLRSCKGLVLREWKNEIDYGKLIKEAQSHFEDINKKVVKYIDDLAEKLNDLELNDSSVREIDVIKKEAVIKILKLKDEFQKDFELDIIIEELKKAENDFLERVIDNMNPELRKDGIKLAEKTLKDYKIKMNPKVYASTQKMVLTSWIKTKLELPTFSLPIEIFQEN
jgi:hypothetical protein